MKLKRLIAVGLLVALHFPVFAIGEKVTLKSSGQTVSSILDRIHKETGYEIFYNDKTPDTDKRVTVDIKDEDLASALDKILKDTDIAYTLRDKQIILSKRIISESVTSAGYTIKGTVTDSNGEPLVGAIVTETGTKNAAGTDIDGNFILKATTTTPDISIQYIGFKPFSGKITDGEAFHAILTEDNNLLNEVVVVGYGVQKKVNLSGAVETVSSKQLESRGVNNAVLALQGLIPNLQVNTGGGQSDSEPSFSIRGESSINGGSPLILVDGVPTDIGDFGRMNVQDIENISVLKDASSAAIYGARASYGVVLVTLKKGAGEKVKVNFNNNFNVRRFTNRPKPYESIYTQAYYHKIMGAPWYDYVSDEELEYAKLLDADPTLDRTIISKRNPSEYTYLHYHNWFDEIYEQNGFSHQHNLSISGETNKVSYYTGIEYYGESGMMRYNKDHYNRFNVRNNLTYRPLDILTLGNNTSFTYYNYRRPTAYNGDLMYTIYNEPIVTMPTYNPDGSYTERGARTVGMLDQGGDKTDKYSAINTQFTAQLDFFKNVWSIKADFNATIKDYRYDQWQSDKGVTYRTGPEAIDRSLGFENYALKGNSKTIYTLLNLYSDFHKDWGKHSVSAIVGYSQEYENWNKFEGKRKDLITDSYPTPSLATGDMTIIEWDHSYTLRSAFYRLNYIFDNKYILETNGRYDGSSRFPHNDRFGFFPSVSAAWVFSNEKFMENLTPWFNHGKLRASYGSLGNQNVDYYSYISSMNAEKLTSLILNGQIPMGVYAPGLVSASLTWEKVHTINGGIDLNFLNNRLTTSFDIYRRDTKDMLTKGRTLPNVLGTSEPRLNAADMKTRGWELSVAWRDQLNLADKPFIYSARFILSDSRSWITKFDNPTNYLGGNYFDGYYEGKEFGEIWGLTTLGFFQSQEEINSSPSQWDVTSYPGDRAIEPGDLKYADLDNSGAINFGERTVDNPGDLSIIGNTSPRYQFGLDLNASWNGFDLRLLFQGVGKRDWYPHPQYTFGRFWGSYRHPNMYVSEEHLDFWTPENPDAYFPRPKSYLAFEGEFGDGTIAQTRYLQNAAYLRLKNLTFGYSLPKRVLEKIKMQQLRIYFSGDNLFEATKLSKEFDPEQLSGTTIPIYRTYTVGLNITF